MAMCIIMVCATHDIRVADVAAYFTNPMLQFHSVQGAFTYNEHNMTTMTTDKTKLQF